MRADTPAGAGVAGPPRRCRCAGVDTGPRDRAIRECERAPLGASCGARSPARGLRDGRLRQAGRAQAAAVVTVSTGWAVVITRLG
jgi:hypothetical protein